MGYLAKVIANSFRQMHPGDSYYIAEKTNELKELSDWDAIGYFRQLDREHRWFVADSLGLQLGDIESALQLYIAVWDGRSLPISDELKNCIAKLVGDVEVGTTSKFISDDT